MLLSVGYSLLKNASILNCGAEPERIKKKNIVKCVGTDPFIEDLLRSSKQKFNQ
jgi:hypothetical protein